jgi:CubicO group peptidase (beta-lactamase class C family)
MGSKTVIQLFFICLLYSNVVTAQNHQTQLDSLFTSLSKNELFNGTVLIAENERIIYQKSFGYANFEKKILNDNNTNFQLASVSKVFTAVAVLQLMEKGKLKLDDEYKKYFPAFPYAGITIRQLLSHSSGISDQDVSAAINDYDKKIGTKHTNAELIALLAEAKVKLKLAPGEKWWYSNTGYELLATLVEKLSITPFNRYLYTNIFQPVGMKNTYLKSDFLEKQDTTKLAGNYDYEFRYSTSRIKMEGENSYYNEASYGFSNIISTTNDLLLFDHALYEGKLLKLSTLDETYTPAILKNGQKDFVWKDIGGMGDACDGLGWFIFEDTSAGKIVWHAGGMQGCATIFLRNITKHQTVILLDNTSSEGLYKSGLDAMNILNDKTLLSIKKSLAKLYGKALMGKNATYASCILNQYKNDSIYYSLSEDDMNNLGYDFLSNNLIPQAIETFKINTFLYPESDNAYNSYAEALQKAEKKEEAIMMYKKSLQINSGNKDSQNSLSVLEAK